MSKLSKRIDKLFLKTHVFISAKNFSLIRDYYKAFLEEKNVKLEDLKEDCNRFEEILFISEKDRSIDEKQEFEEILNRNPIIWEVLEYHWAIGHCRDYPNGRWFSRKGSGEFLKEDLQTAKEYFSRKQKFNF